MPLPVGRGTVLLVAEQEARPTEEGALPPSKPGRLPGPHREAVDSLVGLR